MTIAVGDRIPDATFRVMTAEGPSAVNAEQVFKGRKVILFGVPGAFTPTCHKNHLPGYLARFDELRAKGVDAIAVTSVNDVFVMDAWAKATGADGKIEFLADGSADFAKAVGLSADRSAFGMGTRSQRYSMLVEDGVVTALNVEEGAGKAELSGADKMLADLSERAAAV
ncbi:peroxiredoxin [Alsobacter sp. SYSU M60028]|uniref:Glutathione-dependent peroxiredoxin n=1 Tax=Alsobacter ponti TaxID=2962936 RepID=A0ABT1LCN1_9HYPH|nr:peroxiredoxin [Alsobacter ponti]MCP8939229.1 peroxiredoxin [Alsobacter ponti]